MKKITIYLLMIIFVVWIVEANLIVEMDESVDVISNQEKTLSMNITNNLSIDILDLIIIAPNYITFNKIEIIPSKSSIISNLNIKTNSEFNQNIDIKFSFDYLVDVNKNLTDKQISMTSTGFTPQSINIIQGSTLIWRNDDTVLHNVRSSYFVSPNLLPNQTYTRVMNEIDNYNYNDDFIGYIGNIVVENISSLEHAHDSSLDVTKTLNVISQLTQSALEIEYENKIFNTTYNGIENGLIKIKNIGSNDILNIILSSDSNWITFKENNFNLSINSNKFIQFDLLPLINNIAETDKIYNIQTKISSSNTQDYTENIEVYIQPSSNVIPQNISSLIELRKIIEEALRQLDSLNETNPELISGILNETRNIITFNFTEEQLLNDRRLWAETATSAENALNLIRQTQDQLQTTLDLYNSLNESIGENTQLTKETAEQEKSNRRAVFTGLALFVLFGSSGGIFMLFVKLNKKRQIMKKEFQ